MTDRPILFQPPLVRAILEGRKTQTRRALDPQPAEDIGLKLAEHPIRYAIGDQLWVRETYSGPYECSGTPPRKWDSTSPIWYWADGNPFDGDWTKPKPGIHMPRWASRLTLIVTNVRIERLQAITTEDAEAEGVELTGFDSDERWKNYFPERNGGNGFLFAENSFRTLWQSIHGAGSWDVPTWVVAVTFRVEKRNVDEAAAV